MSGRSNLRGALVTGASSGLGEAFARRLARDGFRVTLVARRRERLEALADELEGQALVADLATDAGVDEVIAAIEAGPAPELLVNAAGFGTRRFVVELDPERLEAMVRLHVLAAVRLTRAVLPSMVAAGRGGVINVSSMAAFFTTSRYTTYSATKAFLNTFTEGLAVELDGTGVTVQALCPGLTRTEFFVPADQEGFAYSAVPSWAWQTAEEVVEESLSGLDRGASRVIPGRLNRVFVGAMRSPLFAALVARASKKTINDEDRPW